MNTITKEQFALWSFLYDLRAGCYHGERPRIRRWTDLPSDEQDSYIEEAKMYLKMPRSDWPLDILKRIK